MSDSAAVRAGRSRAAYLTTHLVNPGLYLKGLSRLLLQGLALGILSFASG